MTESLLTISMLSNPGSTKNHTFIAWQRGTDDHQSHADTGTQGTKPHLYKPHLFASPARRAGSEPPSARPVHHSNLFTQT